MKQYKKSFRNIDSLKKIDLSASDSYSKILQLLSDMIIPVDYVTLKKGRFIFRARINNNCEKYNFKEQLSYRQDFNKIENYGRANEIGQSVFYASSEVETAIFETSSITRNNIDNQEVERITVGCWRVIEDFSLIAVISNNEVQEKNPIMKDIFNESQNRYKVDQKIDLIRNFFSDEFAKNVHGDNNKYKISCAYFNYIISRYENKGFGILFPSVEYDYKGINIALLPEAVDCFLVLDSVEEYDIINNKEIIQVEVKDVKSWTTRKINI